MSFWKGHPGNNIVISMNSIRFITAMTGILAMRQESALAYLPLFDKAISSPLETTAVRDFTYGYQFSKQLFYVSEFGEAAPPELAKPGDIAVISFSSMITRHDYWYWSGVYTKNDLLQRALSNPNIKGVILVFDSPGGEASAPDIIQSTIRKATKPIYAYVDGLCASAAYEIAASAKSITARSEFSEIGSIGTFTSLADWKGYYEKKGVKLIEVYATASEFKNYEVRQALAGNLEPLQKRIDELNNLFIASVKQDRGALIQDADAFKGKIYSASAAKKSGLIDDIAPLDMVANTIGSFTKTSKKLIIC